MYRWLDETDFTDPSATYNYSRPDGTSVSITHAQYTGLMEGGYFTAKCKEQKKSPGLVAAIAYIAYARFIMNNPINATAFGVVHKHGEFSTSVNDAVLVRNANEARKIGEAYLQVVIEHLTSLNLLGCGNYTEVPREIIRVGQSKL